MYASNYLETGIINLMRGFVLNKPTALYVGLFLSDPGDTGTGGTEVNYTGYARQRVTFGLIGNNSIQNSAQITFPEAQASVGSQVSDIGIFDSLTGSSGNAHMWLYGHLTTPLTIQPNVSPIFRVGSIKWTMNGNISTTYKQNILNLIRGQITKLDPFAPYIGLCKSDPTNNIDAEFSSIYDYARFPVSFDEPIADQDNARASMTSNSSDVSSPNPASGPWGTLTHIGVYTAQTGGSLFFSAPLSTSYNMNEGSVAGFRAGQLTFSVN